MALYPSRCQRGSSVQSVADARATAEFDGFRSYEISASGRPPARRGVVTYAEVAARIWLNLCAYWNAEELQYE